MERGRGKRGGREGGVEGGVEGGRKGTEDINRSIANDNSVQLYTQPHLWQSYLMSPITGWY